MSCCLLSILQPLVAAEPTKIGLVEIQGVLSATHPGNPYNRLLNEILPALEEPSELYYLANAENRKLMLEGKLDCGFPDNLTLPSDVNQIIYSDAVNAVKAHIFTKRPVVYTALSQLKGKLVAYPRGYTFDQIIKANPDLTFIATNSPQQAFRLITMDRVDAYLDYIPDIYLRFSVAELSMLTFDPNAPLRQAADRFICFDNAKNRQRIQKLNRKIETIKVNGELERILGKFYVNPD